VNSSDLPALLQGFFTGKLVIQRQASPATVASYRGTFTLLLGFTAARASRQPHQLQVTDLDAETIGAFLTHLEKERGSSIPTRNARLAAIRSFFRYAALHAPQHAQLIAQVLAIPAKRAGKATVTWLTGPDTEALTAAPDRSTWHGRRDHALLLTAVHTGLRVSELTGLTIADTHLADGPHLRCHGKGRKERCTPLTPNAAKILRAWIKERGGQPEDPLFPSRRGTRLSRDAVARLVAVHAGTAARDCPSISGKHVTPHTLRHSTAMALLRAGVDTSVIALWLGHESPETTQAYLHADMEIKKRALARVNPPGGTPGRYHPPDSLIAYLKTL
jgi:site-specific recombinase XerD